MNNLLQFSKSRIYNGCILCKAIIVITTSFLILASTNYSGAVTVTNLTGFYRSGQVFLTWSNISNSTALYKIYRSKSKIEFGSQISTAEYLGYVNYHSSFDHNLTNADGVVKYQRIDSSGIPLNSSTGLFVATTLIGDHYYYAVTTVANGVEDLTITVGSNSLLNSIAETVSTPMPVFQETRVDNKGKSFSIYTVFISSKYDINQPLIVAVGSMAFDFAYSINGSGSNNSMRLFFHGGGRTFISSVTATSTTSDVRLEIEDFLPDSTINTAWWGCNPAYDILNDNNNVPPTSGTNINFSQQKINRVIDWAIHHLPIDSNRIYIDATSDGSAPGFLYALTYPERIAAVEVHTGAFNMSYLTDWIYNCSLNTGYKNRDEVDNLLGEVPTNLMCNLGIHTFDALNGGWVIHQYQDRNYPLIFSINGKNDEKMGWTEKTVFYDSLNNNRLGGYFFWDNRDHTGNNKFWNVDNYDLYRYRRNVSFPAFSFCSLNEDWGDGNGTTGAEHGSVNGMLDWNDNIIDMDSTWEVKVCVKNLVGLNSTIVIYPDSCTADITPRRTQKFSPSIGTTLNWQTTHNGVILQSGTIVCNGQQIVVPQVKIFKDTTVLNISIENLNTYYRDADIDNYGDPGNTVEAETAPSGYVTDNTDCNDANAAINPGKSDICNSIDDNCNGTIDDNAIIATVTPNGTVNVCDGSTIVLSANGGIGITYQWIKGSKNILGETSQTYLSKKAADYKVSETNTYGCASTSAATTIALLTLPTATITSLGNLDICIAGSVTLQANSGVGYIYAWKKGTSFLSGETNQNYIATKTGTFKVQVTNSSGCSKTSTGVKVTKSCKAGDKIQDDNKGVTIYPNPAKDFATIKFNLQQASLVSIKIYDLSGKEVQTLINKELEPGNHEELINTSSLTSGMYLVKLICDEGIYNIPFIIQ